jgi:uncharacterized protein YndB with AHSA1/START domain
MATAKITDNLDTIVSEIDIAVPIERVFKAIADANEVKRRSPQLTAYEMDLRPGGRWHLEMHLPSSYRGVDVIRHDGEVLEVDPPRLLVHTWFANFHKNPRSRSVVRWELTSTPSGTHVKVTHSGLSSEPDAARDYAGGWPGVLAEVKKWVEQQNQARLEHV